MHQSSLRARRAASSKSERIGRASSNAAGFGERAAREYKKVAELAAEAKLSNAKALATKAEQTDKEARAEELFAKARFAIARKDFVGARRMTAMADALTRLNRVKLNELLGEIDEAEVVDSYRRAEVLELDHRYEEALAAYQKLASRDPDGGAATKVETIQTLLKDVAQLYAQAQKALEAKKPAEAAGLWQQILSVHPRYKDVAKLHAEHRGAESANGKN